MKVTTTGVTSAPQFTGHLNVYEFIFDPPVEVKEGYVLGYHQPPYTESRLGLVTIQGKGPENYCVFGENPDTSTQSSTVKILTHTPFVTFEYGELGACALLNNVRISMHLVVGVYCIL